MGATNGGGHIYLLDANGRKIAAIWGKAGEKEKTADLIIEATTEDLPIKLEVFGTLDDTLRPEVVIASNTSSLPITDMAAVSVPIRSSSGTPVAALHLTAITQRLAQPRRDNIVAALRHEVEAIEHAYRPVLDAMEPRAQAASSALPVSVKATTPLRKAATPTGRRHKR